MRIAEKVRLGPNRSSRLPMTRRAGTVRARLHSPRVTSCGLVSPNCLPIVDANGAKLNHTTKLTKKANHVRCRVRVEGPARKTDRRSARSGGAPVGRDREV